MTITLLRLPTLIYIPAHVHNTTTPRKKYYFRIIPHQCAGSLHTFLNDPKKETIIISSLQQHLKPLIGINQAYANFGVNHFCSVSFQNIEFQYLDHFDPYCIEQQAFELKTMIIIQLNT